MNMVGKSISELVKGEKSEFTKTVSESDVYLYAGVTGDLNPAHINEAYAKNTFFKTRIAHGMLLGGFISAVIGTRLPGPGTIYVSQELYFKAPVKLGETVSAVVEVAEIDIEKNRAVLKTTCINEQGTLLVDGKAVVSPPKKKK
jgi:3-hydroxybutyryl-CoA dehydratase